MSFSGRETRARAQKALCVSPESHPPTSEHGPLPTHRCRIQLPHVLRGGTAAVGARPDLTAERDQPCCRLQKGEARESCTGDGRAGRETARGSREERPSVSVHVGWALGRSKSAPASSPGGSRAWRKERVFSSLADFRNRSRSTS